VEKFLRKYGLPSQREAEPADAAQE
jgi:hypothetical protein